MPIFFSILLAMVSSQFSSARGVGSEVRLKCWNDTQKANIELSLKGAALLCAKVKSVEEISALISCWREVFTAYPVGKDMSDTNAAILCANQDLPSGCLNVNKKPN